MTEIQDGKPYPGRVTIVYAPRGWLTAKSMTIPRDEFLDACSKFADNLDQPLEKNTQPV